MTLTLIILIAINAIYTMYWVFKADFYRLQRDRALKELEKKEFKHINEALMYIDLETSKRLN